MWVLLGHIYWDIFNNISVVSCYFSWIHTIVWSFRVVEFMSFLIFPDCKFIAYKFISKFIHSIGCLVKVWIKKLTSSYLLMEAYICGYGLPNPPYYTIFHITISRETRVLKVIHLLLMDGIFVVMGSQTHHTMPLSIQHFLESQWSQIINSIFC